MPELRHPNSEPASSAVSINTDSGAVAENVSTKSAVGSGEKVRVSFLTEQTSHHPPVSAWVVECPEKQVIARGYDQIAAKFTGTSVRITAGNHNHGIFISLGKWNEEYQLTHPAAHVSGLLRGMCLTASRRV
jgi:oxysterol-binding protein-related protein 9/10/11